MKRVYNDDSLIALQCAVAELCVQDLKPPHQIQKYKQARHREASIYNANTSLNYILNVIGLDEKELIKLLKDKGWTETEILLLKHDNYKLKFEREL